MKPKIYMVLVFILGLTSTLFSSTPPHGYDCFVCHDLHNAPGGSLGRYSTNVALCQSCHSPGGDAERFVISEADSAVPGIQGITHRFNVNSVNSTYDAEKPTNPELRQRLEYNPDFPDSAVVCATCHDQHSQDYVPFLRISSDSLCISCHEVRARKSTTIMVDFRSKLGDDCTECHGWHGAMRDSVWASHFIQVQLPTNSNDFSIPQSLPLVNFTVQCATCHTAHRGYSSQAVVGIAESGTEVSLTDNDATWTNNAFAGWKLLILDRTGVDTSKWHQIRTIQSNTSNTLNWAPDSLSFPVQQGDTFLIQQPTNGDGYLLFTDMKNICTQCHTFSGNGIHLSQTNGALWPGNGYGTDYAHLNRTGGDSLLPPKVTGIGVFNQPLPSNMKGSCYNCHWPHGWVNPNNGTLFPYTLVADPDQLCKTCHDADGPGPPVFEVEQNKQYIHHGYCLACHNSHKAEPGNMPQPGSAPDINPELYGKFGVEIDSTPVSIATKQYQLCFSCHDNIRTQIKNAQENGNGYHPVHTQGQYDGPVPSLYNGWTENDLVYCTDCHNNDTGSQNGGPDPAGPHGSQYHDLLERNYVTTDNTPYQYSNYALCFKCHDQMVLFTNMSGFREHREHVRGEDTPCSICHNNPHAGNFKHLITFDRDVVSPSNSGRLEFIDTGYKHGKCYLKCHNKNHDPKSY